MAAVDAETDASTTDMLREACSTCTLLTIAHRLRTIIDYDRIAVMDAGHLKEFEPPATLLGRSESLFAQLVAATGTESAQQLSQAARSALRAKAALEEEEPPKGANGSNGSNGGGGPRAVLA